MLALRPGADMNRRNVDGVSRRVAKIKSQNLIRMQRQAEKIAAKKRKQAELAASLYLVTP